MAIPLVTQGQYISSSVMQTLASASNISHIPQWFPSELPFNQAFWVLGDYEILSSGSGFPLGYVMTDNDGYYSEIAVSELTPISNSVVGIQFITYPFIPWNNGVAGPTAITYSCPTTGSPFILGFTTGSYIQPTNAGTTPFAFAPALQNQGTTIQVGITDGGINYKVSESLLLNSIGNTYNVTVTSTGSLGTITAIQPTFPYYNAFINGDSNFIYPSSSTNGISYGSASGSNAIFHRKYYMPPPQQNGMGYGGWLDELNRIRNNIAATASNMSVPNYEFATSGPWPSAGPVGSEIDNYASCSFYFAYRGLVESCSLTCNAPLCGYTDAHSTYYIGYDYWTIGGFVFSTASVIYEATKVFIVGGTSSIHVSGSFGLTYIFNPTGYTQTVLYNSSSGAYISQSNYSPTQVSAAMSTITLVGTNSPGTYTTTIQPFETGAAINVFLAIDQMVSPGYYYMTVKCTEPNDTATGYGGVGDVVTCNNRLFIDLGVGDPTNLTSVYTYTGQGPCAAVSTASIYSMSISADSVYHMPSALGSIWYSFGSAFESYPYPDIELSKSPLPAGGGLFDITWQMSTNGLWSNYQQPVNQLNYLQFDDMPWNYQLGKVLSDGMTVYEYNPMLSYNPTLAAITQNSFIQTQSIEYQLTPPPWISGSYWTSSFVICDNNLCWQQCITSGYGGAAYPNFSHSINSITHDNTAQWQCVFVPSYLGLSSSWLPNHYYALGSTVKDELGWTWTNVAFNISQSSGASSSVVNPFIKYSGSYNNYYRPPQVIDYTASITLSQSVAMYHNGITLPNLWQCTTSQSANVVQPCLKNNNQYDIPCYPYYWQNETNAYLIPPTSASYTPTAFGCGYQWLPHSYQGTGVPLTYDGGWSTNNAAYGYFIYKIAISRIGNNFDSQTGKILEPTNITGSIQQIPVTIGCYFTGNVFSSFGTWNTGQTINCMIPIFCSVPIVYQANERVQLSIWAITNPSNGWTILQGYPLISSYYNDTANAVNLLTF